VPDCRFEFAAYLLKAQSRLREQPQILIDDLAVVGQRQRREQRFDARV
jgi:hypothetical protein